MRAVKEAAKAHKGSVARASVPDTARTAMKVLAPTLAVGVIARRPHVFGLADRFDADLVALRQMQALARRYGPGPVSLRVPGRKFAMVISPEHVRQVLDPSSTAGMSCTSSPSRSPTSSGTRPTVCRRRSAPRAGSPPTSS